MQQAASSQDDIKNIIMLAGLAAAIIWNIYQWLRAKTQDTQASTQQIEKINARVDSLEFKVGLFWRLVEDHMSTLLAKANPINLTLDEQAAARVYDTQKRHSPTNTLKVLAKAIKRELPNLSSDEKAVFVCLLGAIISQLYDRGELEWLEQNDLTRD